MPNLRLSQLLALVIISTLLLFQHSVEVETVRAQYGWESAREVSLIVVPVVPVTIQSLTNKSQIPLDPPTISAKSIYIEDLTSQTILLSTNETTQFPPASTVKLMTALVALESYTPQTVLTVQGSDILLSNALDFTVGEQITVEDLLKCLLISSSNEAAEILAREFPSGYQGFVDRMNAKASELGLQQTSFANPIGYDASTQYSSARDLHLLANHFMNAPLLKAIVKEPLLIINDITGTKQHVLKTTNQLLDKNFGAIGIKTGTTPLAGEVLISQFQFENHEIRMIMMGSTQRFEDSRLMLEWINDTLTWIKPTDLFQQL